MTGNNRLMSYYLVDDFLSEEDYKNIKTLMHGNDFPWFLQDGIVAGDGKDDPLDTLFTHYIYSSIDAPVGPKSPFYDAYLPLIEKIGEAIVIRIKANCYPRTESLKIHEFHVDHTFQHETCLLSLSSNDGYTLLETGDKIASVENRALFTKDLLPHASTNCTNLNCRINLNVTFIRI